MTTEATPTLEPERKPSRAKVGVRRLVSQSTLPRRLYHSSQGVRTVVHGLADVVDAVLHRRDDLTPPRRLAAIGRGDPREIGQTFRRYLVELGGLKPDDRVLDVGCGIGRMAVPLTDVLTDGRYEGVDIMPNAVEWCQANITPRYPNFRFQVADVYNKQYNSKGTQRPTEYHFPFADDSFDFVFLTSVFTHMLPSSVENYVGEISRVLDRGGTCFATFFLLNDESRRLIDSGDSRVPFQYALEDEHGLPYLTSDKDTPEHDIGLDETYVRDILARNGLHTIEPVHYGYWSDRDDYLSFQDIVIARRQ